MGQAKNRKAEIDALKATGPKTKITKFMIRGDINQDGTVSFNTDTLDQAQRDFVESCQRVINTEQVPEMAKKGTTATPADSLAYVMYNTSKDFAASLLVGVKTTPDQAWQQLYDAYLGKPQRPQVGDRFNRAQLVKMGTEQAGLMMDMLVVGGVWPWPNAGVVLERQGNQMVVVDLL